MTLYSYTIVVDSGFAPNPFHGFCTLACCKPGVRRTAQEGDYVVGIAPKELGNRLVYAMRVTDIVEFDDYWHDKRFRIKRPDIEEGGEKALGDNVYHRNRAAKWQQAPSQHSLENGQQDWELTRQDISGEKVLISDDFIYWGGDGPPLPHNLRGLIVGRSYRSSSNDEYMLDFKKWFAGQRDRGLMGRPTEEMPPTCLKRRKKRRKLC